MSDFKTQITFPERIVIVMKPIPNVVVGQTFAFDHPSLKHVSIDTVKNIQHAVDIEGNVVTYVDVNSVWV